ncbi:RHS repeat-associated core domain-containing protein [Variovorax paradoxus]|uniref:RHS repeat-associated core domain-containing protein n=1 Tax=Variovorax paradoxus TaxID=34073 RepID=UPI002854FA50|nr:RHS repeat-associated core domain-containing protein [Variovorax paradoxus]MDR6453877.1 RHS repeat-associated protein [Variovorax paradoxus]
MRDVRGIWLWVRLVFILAGLNALLLPAHAQVGAYWEHPPVFDGTQARGSWATIKAFSEQKVLELYAPQGFVAKCIWLTPEPVPPRTIVGDWGGTYYFSDGTTAPCGGTFLAKWVCPANSTSTPDGCKCAAGYQEDPAGASCVKASPEPQSCGIDVGNPINPATAEKLQSEVDLDVGGPGALTFERTYRSSWGADPTRPAVGLGKAWTHNHTTKLEATPGSDPIAVSITSSEGYLRTFAKVTGSAIWTATNSGDLLVQLGNGTWTWRRADDDAVLAFTGDGKLQTKTDRNGWVTIYTYNGAGQLSTIANAFGRALALTYNGAGQLNTVISSDSRVVGYLYDAAGRLSSVIYPDLQTRTYVYENASYSQALTGVLDETGARFASFAYDSLGRAITTEHSGGVDRYQVSYLSSNGVTVIDPLGTSRNVSYTTVKGKLAAAGSSLTSGSGEPEVASRAQDSNGLITSETDFKGVVTTTSWDVARRLPTTVVRAAGTAEALTITTQWHPTFSLPALVTESGRTTAYTYDALGNTLSKTVTDAATNKARLWQWTYNAQQLVATATEPNGAETSYTYNPQGNVLASTNALGHVTSYTYDTANRVVSSTAPNGLVTSYTYDPRDRLLTQTVGGQTTTLTYKPYGTVETVSLPTGLVLTYSYDAAHRLVGWSNNRGESGTYTLDGMGNRTAEQIKDSAGNVAWNAARTINNINRLSAQTEGPNQASSFGYDANGELITQTNGLNQSTQYGLDGLRRVKAVTDAASATATLKYNALDAVTEAKDFKGVATTYARDAQGNATAESSADTGPASTQYDALGLPSQITDALGQATTITRDALGRPTSLVFADGKTTTLRYDLSANSKGYLSEIVDRSGTTEYTRDGFGRVTLKKQTLANGSVQQVSYSYNPNGTLASIGYPNGGGLLTHSYDATGRLTGLSLNGNPLVTGIAWNPLGQPTAWTWAFASPSLAASRSYDTAGRMTATEFSSYFYDAAGRITSLTQNLYAPGDTDPTHSTIGASDITWTVGYNAVGRVTGFNATGSTAGFGYDANGNRSSSTRELNGQSTSRTYSVGATSNQLTGFTQSINGASTTSVAYGYNANGDLVSDGLRSYTYDAEGRLAAATTGATDVSPTTRYAHNALGQRVFKTEPLYPPGPGDEADPGFMQSLIAFFTKLWSPSTTQAEQLGYAYTYDENGTLIAEAGSGGANSAGQSQYIYLPTANGPMPIAAVINGATYAVHSDHLNTPRKLTNADGQAVWQWSYSAFGADKPTIARNRFANLDTTPNPGTTSISDVKFSLRYPGQYADEESGLFYNYFRSYDARTGRYSQPDPIGLKGGWNRFGYVDANPLTKGDPLGLWSVTLDAYVHGVGGGFVVGRDPNTGGPFVSGRWGFGLGGGIAYDRNGGRPGGDKGASCDAGAGLGLYGWVGGNVGPLQGAMNASAGTNFNFVTPPHQLVDPRTGAGIFFGRPNQSYGDISPSWSLGNSQGLRGGAGAGVEGTIFGPGR